jgi:iron complex outermembrane recepter protein
MKILTRLCFLTIIFLQPFLEVNAQTMVRGVVRDAGTKEALIGSSIIIKGTGEGTVSDFDGSFELNIKSPLPVSLIFSYTGFEDKEIEVTEADEKLKIQLAETTMIIDAIEIREKRLSDKQRESALTVEAMDIIAIKETPQIDFYKGLGSLKGVDLTTASLGFTIINTRGFNSTSPVRSLQVIDGVDNASPGLNFSLGNFLGAPELDVQKVELIAGASSAYYGPNAFNGVIDMTTKDPFLHKGLSVSLKYGERDLFEGAIRWADAFKNKKGEDKFAYKFNFFFLRANDWEATNYEPTEQSKAGVDNPGGYDAVNIYGDENTDRSRDYNDLLEMVEFPGLGIFHRRGYKEVDLVDYNTRNLKGNAALHYKITRDIELIGGFNTGNGTTVYQGENRFSLKDIRFWQAKMELRQANKFFLRAYRTQEDAGKSYDAYFTALLLQKAAKPADRWTRDYTNYWQVAIRPRVEMLEGYPQGFPFDFEQQASVLAANQDLLYAWQLEAQAVANKANVIFPSVDFYEPGTARFDSLFQEITSRLPSDPDNPGTLFYDKSALNHIHGQYQFDSDFANVIVGANFRQYTPDSKGTIFIDTMGRKITNWEVGGYAGLEKKFLSNHLKFNFTVRIDKNENFDPVMSPAASLVYTPNLDNLFRISFSSAIRNPTLSDQFLNYNVGRAILRGNIDGVDSLVTIESMLGFFSSKKPDELVYFNEPSIQPERVKTIEVGWRGTLWNSIWLDANYYYSFYDDFIGYKYGADLRYDQLTKLPTFIQPYRISANAESMVTTQGFSLGVNYYFPKYLVFTSNYTWNKLNKKGADDPIIPAYNTPEHKFNVGLSGREMQTDLGFVTLRNFGFGVYYKWIQGFTFEGSPQFTGKIPTYDLLDVQINYGIPAIHTTVKIGASNVLNKKQVQTYGGPRVGRLAYISLLYEWKKRDF